MSEGPYDADLTVREQIELELCGINAVIDTVQGPKEFVQWRDRLVALLDHLDRGALLPEYAEVQLEQLQELMEQWSRDNAIPPD